LPKNQQNVTGGIYTSKCGLCEGTIGCQEFFKEIELVDTIVRLDDQRKKLQLESDTAQSRINARSKEIGQLMATKGSKEEAEAGSRK